MLEPREADIPVLFLVLVVLPVVAYILLGKWSETSKKKERVSLLAQLAAEEAFRAETMAAAASVAPEVSPSNNGGFHVCARCFSPATTRCSRCKSVRYCSGKCQIIHWRHVHKEECVPVETCSVSSSKVLRSEDPLVVTENHSIKQPVREKAASNSVAHPSTSTAEFAGLNSNPGDTSQIPVLERRSTERRYSSKSNRESSRGERDNVAVFDSSEEPSQSEAACLASADNGSSREARHRNKPKNSDSFASEEISIRHNVQESSKHQGQHENVLEPRSAAHLNAQYSTKGGKASRLPKLATKKSGEHSCSDTDRKGQMAGESKVARTSDTVHVEETNGVSNMGIMKIMGLRKATKTAGQNLSQFDDRYKKVKMLFSYEEFIKLFQCEVFDVSPRGLVNCGNSCYANAVLQCLTSTKPLVVYLLRRSHSRSCCGKDWCLMCELEQHVMMLREGGGPLSPSRILSHMRSINCQIGDGSQEDAHEFLRLLVASMQSICLEGLGGESKVEPRLQETTFIQHAFGGRLRSKVKCLRCHHESERYENIMDLTLEIYGWVESLQDALTQFTTPEDLDGENMYRCGRCSEYVRARKQLSIHEAPNILTIVLKRFQEGRYGKINKCITFPEVLDMIPFMTGMGDVPPLYMLYGVVVHLDTLNASFSGHYVSYVKDLRGNWFRIDDSEIHHVPMSQVMSEGAYILFYMRSYPRPQRSSNGKAQKQQVPALARRCQSREQSKATNHFVGTHPSSDHLKPKFTSCYDNHVEYSDATSSDWSLFTSSDEASFTTESTRDSFSTIDYTDACNSDPFSIFNTLYHGEPSSRNTVACRMFSGTQPQTRYLSDEKSYVLDSFHSNYGMYVNYETNPGYSMDRTYSYQ